MLSNGGPARRPGGFVLASLGAEAFRCSAFLMRPALAAYRKSLARVHKQRRSTKSHSGLWRWLAVNDQASSA